MHGLYLIHLVPYIYFFLENCKKIVQIVDNKIGTWTLSFEQYRTMHLSFRFFVNHNIWRIYKYLEVGNTMES